MDEEWNSFQNETNGNSTMEYDPRSLTEEMVFKFDFYSNYLVLVLPFLFAHSMVEPFQVFNEFLVADHKTVNITLGSMAPPLIGFFCFFIGKGLKLTDTLFATLSEPSSLSKLPIYIYSETCFSFLSFFWLHFLLAAYEFFFYWYVNVVSDLANNILTTSYDIDSLLRKCKKLIFLMVKLQSGFGRFLVVDLSLMLQFWLLHTFNAYTSFQVNYQRALSSVLVIAAEFSRVFYLSTKCGKFSEQADQVIMKLEETRVESEKKHDKKVID